MGDGQGYPTLLRVITANLVSSSKLIRLATAGLVLNIIISLCSGSGIGPGSGQGLSPEVKAHILAQCLPNLSNFIIRETEAADVVYRCLLGVGMIALHTNTLNDKLKVDMIKEISCYEFSSKLMILKSQ